MDSDYLTPVNLLVFRGTCCIGNGSAAIFCFSFIWTTVFLYFLKGSFRCSYFYSSIVGFRSDLSVHSHCANQDGYIQ